MRRRRFAAGLLTGCALAGVLSLRLQVLKGQQIDDRIPSLLEQGEALTISATSPLTGHATFASSRGRGILVAAPESAGAAERALAFIASYGRAFGITGAGQVRLQRASGGDSQGFEHVRFQQVYQGVPVTAAELTVHLKGSRVMVANGHLVDDLPASVVPIVPAEAAQTTARAVIGKKEGPDRALRAQVQPATARDLQSRTPGRAACNLATGVVRRGERFRSARYTWVDAATGAVLLNFSQLAPAKSRRIYTAGEGSVLPGTLLRTEGGPATGDLDADLAYDYAGSTYDYYLTTHGRDSFDNAGGALISTVHYCDPNQSCPMENAFWNGTQMVYGTTYSRADDVVGHELTHAVTERSANLFYYMQSGALNESFSDIFGETIDLLNGQGNDTGTVRWRMGEDIGAIRDMMTPTLFDQPGKVSDPQFWCSAEDGGGVHINSGVPNHAYALMVDGGTYNGRSITGIGLTKASKIQYRTLTVYLTSGSGFADNYLAVNQACSDLVGSSGITAADCGQVNSALLAVEMPNRWNCSGATAPAPLCPVPGTVPATVFVDGFEGAAPAWTPTSNVASAIWAVDTGFAKSGLRMANSTDQFPQADGAIAMNSSVTIPAGGRLSFDHAFDFEFGYDGGVLEISTNNGASWSDAGGLVDGGQTYNSTLFNASLNPIGGRPAFSDASFGYTSTRLNLASLAGQSVRFRFRLGTDVSVYQGGWVVDNVRIYSCVASQPRPGDVDGDNRSDIGVYRPGTGTWYILKSSTNFAGYATYTWGMSTDVPMSGDYDGDGRADLTVYRPATGTWHILKSSTNFTGYAAYTWGASTDVPMSGDYDGDGRTDVTRLPSLHGHVVHPEIEHELHGVRGLYLGCRHRCAREWRLRRRRPDGCHGLPSRHGHVVHPEIEHEFHRTRSLYLGRQHRRAHEWRLRRRRPDGCHRLPSRHGRVVHPEIEHELHGVRGLFLGRQHRRARERRLRRRRPDGRHGVPSRHGHLVHPEIEHELHRVRGLFLGRQHRRPGLETPLIRPRTTLADRRRAGGPGEGHVGRAGGVMARRCCWRSRESRIERVWRCGGAAGHRSGGNADAATA